MLKTIEELLQSPYWIVDILPEQVTADSPGQYFRVEDYFLEKERFSMIKQKHINLILKLNCYREISIYGEDRSDPDPEHIAERMRKEYLYIMIDGSMILSECDDTHLTVFDPDDGLLELIKILAVSEGLYVWKPQEKK